MKITNDTIYRCQAIDTMQMFIDSLDKESPAYKSLSIAFDRCIIELKRMPSAQPHWIPCSERLPKYPFRVQIQLDNGWIITGYYSEEHWYTVPHCGGFLRNDEVEAWRELPEPYGGESDE